MVLELVGDDERHLGLRRARCPVEATDGDDPVTDGGHQSQTVDVVDGREARHLGGGQGRVEGEETKVNRVGRKVAMERDQLLRVVGSDRPDVVAQPPSPTTSRSRSVG